MGIKLFSDTQDDKNPDPKNFSIEMVEKYDNCYISIIKYPNCVNFEGKKILLSKFDPSFRNNIDPHFSHNYGLIARFEPTEDGLIFARKCSSNY